MHRIVLSALLVLLPLSALADLRPADVAARSLSITLRDGKPMLAAEIGGRAGVVMFDIGTPYSLMLNRDALDLPVGQEVARGFTASGQEIVVMLHAAPGVAVTGMPMTLPETLPSGNFGFTRAGLGDDFLGFVGLPAIAETVFGLDLAGQRLVFLSRAPDRLSPLASVAIDLPEAGLPGWRGRIGGLPVALDIDTGDGGTFYVTETTRAAFLAAGLLDVTGPDATLSGLAFGGHAFGPVAVRLVAAGGPEDLRDPPRGDLVRLGARFLSRYPTLWDLPGRTIHILDPAVTPDFGSMGQQP